MIDKQTHKRINDNDTTMHINKYKQTHDTQMTLRCVVRDVC